MPLWPAVEPRPAKNLHSGISAQHNFKNTFAHGYGGSVTQIRISVNDIARIPAMISSKPLQHTPTFYTTRQGSSIRNTFLSISPGGGTQFTCPQHCLTSNRTRPKRLYGNHAMHTPISQSHAMDNGARPASTKSTPGYHLKPQCSPDQG